MKKTAKKQCKSTATVAQLVSNNICVPEVVGSNPIQGFTLKTKFWKKKLNLYAAQKFPVYYEPLSGPTDKSEYIRRIRSRSVPVQSRQKTDEIYRYSVSGCVSQLLCQ